MRVSGANTRDTHCRPQMRLKRVAECSMPKSDPESELPVRQRASIASLRLFCQFAYPALTRTPRMHRRLGE